MRDFDENRNYTDEIEENYETPSVKRRSGAGIRAEKIRQNIDEDNTDFEPVYKRKITHKNDEQPKQKSVRKIIEEEYKEEAEYGKGAPILVKAFSWIALIAILFAIGYGGANYIFKWLDKKNPNKIGNVIANVQERKENNRTSTISGEKYTLYIPSENGEYSKRDVKIFEDTKEKNIYKLAEMYVNSLKETKTISRNVAIKNIFINGDWIYVDFTKDLEQSLKTATAKDGTLFVTGLLKTIKENFAPVRKIKIYIDSNESAMKTPIDITQPWELSE
ncbi:MAG: GerMN domain-containing protein [Synergistaceae bacterium]